MSALPGAQIREWIELLERAGYLETDPVHGGIDTTERAAAVLFSDEQVLARVQRTTLAGPRTQKKAAASRTDEPLLAALKALRFRIAQEQGVPAYIVFSNATLLDMAAKRPGLHAGAAGGFRRRPCQGRALRRGLFERDQTV